MVTVTLESPLWMVTSVVPVVISRSVGEVHEDEECSSNQPESPGAGHQAVEFSSSTAAVRERAGFAPPKAEASAADEDAVTRPSCSTTWVSGPAEG